ncbi:protein kinase [Paenibacillus sp. 11B]|uniref:protein kinase domain-containing protein n=1 Tax=Paenibacillus sp. 11B TaxID=3060965 RepID=UPI00264D38EB|nr:protein kinase [Paenibacillus sp. 11B]MDN8593346.1 protein kinase [Paenibacillus sp. 11B]
MSEKRLKDYVYDDKNDLLGKGGSGNVYRATRDGKQFALKIAQNKMPKKVETNSEKTTERRLKRFEIEARKGQQLVKDGMRGLIPILDFECDPEQRYFLVMPIATPLSEKIKAKHNIYELTAIVRELAQVLVALHEREHSHRDIKPENILFYNDCYCLSDLGLLAYPEKEHFTPDEELVGNRKTVAPELRINANFESDHRPADVYSFAKTAWMILTKEEFAFDGQFNPLENVKLQQLYNKQHFAELYDLLREATIENPAKRPTIKEFLNKFNVWEQIAKDEQRASRSAWQYLERTLLMQWAPSTIIWRDAAKVVEILKQISHANFNHTFVHQGGGMDSVSVEHATWLKEPNMIALSFDFGIVHVFKLKRLVWEIPNDDARFSYFRIEFDTLDPIFPDTIEEFQELDNYSPPSEFLRIFEGSYRPDQQEYDNLMYINRWYDGVFLIVHKGSIYNSISQTYDGRHGELTTDEFRTYMECLQYFYSHPILKDYFRSLAALNPKENNNLAQLLELLTMSDTEIRRDLDLHPNITLE